MKSLQVKPNFKILFKILLAMSMLISVPQDSNAQILKRLKKKIEKKVENEVDDAIDGKNTEETDSKTSEKNDEKPTKTNPEENPEKPAVIWSKYDFIPGDTVIFEDAPSNDEENGEFPSRWDLVKGQVEIANVDNENIMLFIDGNPTIVPYLKNAKEDYLPEIFTIEFDFYKPKKGNRISVYLYDTKNQKRIKPNMYFDISSVRVSEKLDGVTGELPNTDYTYINNPRWIHISIAFTKGKLKVYMDDTRVINIPHYTGNPTGLTLEAYFADLGEDKAFYFKNIRIAKGGVKYYDRMLSEGKIVVNGIKFDTNKATLKPESIGPINTIFELMQKQQDLNFSVEGHTDNDGENEANMTLSIARGKAVMDKLIAMGISPNRLKSTGFGESKPIDNNSTPEGKANNRRVEFVKF